MMATVGSAARADWHDTISAHPRRCFSPALVGDKSTMTRQGGEGLWPTPARAAPSGERVTAFGPFRLLATQRLLLEGEKPLRLGSRALDILIALVERPGELLTKKELMARVWPDTVVEESNLKVHIAALRRTLADGRGGRRYLATIPGRGYRFVAPIRTAEEPVLATAKRPHNLPARLTRLVGRTETIKQLAELLPEQRFITLVGPGGIGKTSVALALAEALLASYEDGVWLVDLALVGEARLVPAALAAALGIEIDEETPLAALLAFLRRKRLLLVLDNCEHVIEAAAAISVAVLKGAPGVHVLATSREPLRAEGEQMQRLAPLECPPAALRLTAPETLSFAAVQLFVERATVTGEGSLRDTDAPLVAEICRKLDGIPLAIELAATRVDALGVRGLAAHLDDRLQMLTSGCRTALARHQSMSASLDWSYGLLTTEEQSVLRRLAIFAGSFTLSAAAAVAADISEAEGCVIDLVSKLVTKSLLAADGDGAEPRFRLLETTRAFVLRKLAESGEIDLIQQRCADYRHVFGDGELR
jgi:predicted ATPase/DNA-binding winged helix-turn-helix (wHTH) protein